MTLKILSQQDVYQRLNEVYSVDVLAPITQLLSHQFHKKMAPAEMFHVSGQKGADAYYLKVELMAIADAGTVFEFFMTHPSPKQLLHGFPEPLIDFVGHALESFFAEDRDARLPLDFTPFPVAGFEVYGRQEYRNFKLEREAEAWLKKMPED